MIIQINEEMLALQQTVDRIRDQLLLPVNHELKKVVNLIEQAEDKLDLEVMIQGFDLNKIEQIKVEMRKISEDFSIFVISENNKATDQKLKKTELVVHPPRKQAPTPVKQSFLSDAMGRSKSQEKIFVKNAKDADTTASKRQFDSQKALMSTSQPRFPVVEVALDPCLLEVDIDDKHFNEFLESELERIKKKFLDEEPSRGLKSRQSKSISENKKVGEPASEGRIKSSKQKGFTNKYEIAEKNKEPASFAQKTPDHLKGRKENGKFGSTRIVRVEKR